MPVKRLQRENHSMGPRPGFHHIQGLHDFTHCKTDHPLAANEFHRHASSMEFFCVLNGLRYRCIDKKLYTICANEILICFPNELHCTLERKNLPFEYFSFQIDLSNKNSLLELGRKSSQLLFGFLTQPTHRHYRINPQHVFLLHECISLLKNQTPENLHITANFLSTFLFSIPQYTPIVRADTETAAENKSIQQVIDHISLHLRECLPLQLLAKVSGYSCAHFELLFKRETGMTPGDYVTTARIRHATILLENTCFDISDVAAECGFSYSNYFSSVFKKVTGLSPREYRLAHKSG